MAKGNQDEKGRSGKLELRGDPPALCHALGKYYGRHSATLGNTELQMVSKMLIEAANQTDGAVRKAVLDLRAKAVSPLLTGRGLAK